MRHLRSVMPVVAIALVGLLAYSNAFHSGFVFDDETEIVNQKLIRDLDNFLGRWDGYRAYPNRALVYVTFALNYRVGGLHTTGYHVVNVLVHLGTALLVYVLVLLSFRTPHLRRSALAPWASSVAVVAALLFVTHPIQTQAVTYIVQRLASLATFFFVLAVVLYVRWRLTRDGGAEGRIGGWVTYAGVLASTVAAMKSKEIALTLPVVIAVYEVAFFAGGWRKRLTRLVPILATIAIVPLSTFGLRRSLGELLSEVAEVKVQTAMSRLDYLRTQLSVIATYLRLLVLPVNQNLDYDYAVSRSFLEPQVALSGLLLLSLAAAAVAVWGGPVVRLTRRACDPASRLVSFGIAWFFVTLSLESSVIPIADVIFEHRVYLPSVGFFVAAASACALLARRFAPGRAAAMTVTVGVLISAPLAAATFARNEVWFTDLSLWSDVVAKSPGKSRPQDNLGLALAHRRREAEAIVHFREAVRLDPTNVRAHNNLGVALAKLGRLMEAKAAFLAALHVDPDHAEALHNLGRIYLVNEGRFEEAATLFQRAIRRRPDYADAYANLGAAWNQLGRYGDTIRLLDGVADTVRTQPHAHFNLGLAYALDGNRGAAQREIRLLESLAPGLAAQLADAVNRQVPAGTSGR